MGGNRGRHEPDGSQFLERKSPGEQPSAAGGPGLSTAVPHLPGGLQGLLGLGVGAQQVRLTGTVKIDAEVPVELIPVELNPAVLQAKAHTGEDQSEKEDAEHGYRGIQQRGAPVTP